MDSKVNYIIVGLFVIAFGAAIIAGVLWLSTEGIRGDYQRYVTYTPESVSGLSVDAPVRYRGVKVGRVAEIELTPGDPTRVRLLLEIEKGTPVKEDTVATLELQGITGLLNVNLTGGSREARALTAKAGEYPVIPSRPSLLGQINDQASVLVDRVTQATERLNRVLSDRNLQALSQTMENLEKTTLALASEADALADTLRDLRQAARQARLAGEALPGTVEQFRQSAAALERMAAEIAGAGTAVRTEVNATGMQMRRFMGETLPTASAVVDELRETAASLRRASESLERDPSVLLYGAEAPEAGPGE